ncbi:MAG: hypothetical protein RSB77_00950 [Bacilli bacterium]
MKDITKNIPEYFMMFLLTSVAVFGIIKVGGGSLEDALTKSSCKIVNRIYMNGQNTGDGYCIDK